MSNLRILYNNIAKSATITPSSEAGSFVVENLQTDEKADIWRTTGKISETLTFSYAAADVNCFVFAFNNLSSTATIRVQCGAVDTGDVLVSEYATIEKIDFGTGALNANTFNFGGGNYGAVYFTTQSGSTSLVATIKDPSNPNSYIEASFVLIGEYWEPVRNADWGAELRLNDNTEHRRNEAGSPRIKRGTRHKVLSFSIGRMLASDRTKLTEIFIRNGSSVPVFLSIFPESADTQEKQVYSIYGYVTRMGSLKRYRPKIDQSSMEIEEV